MTRMTPVLACVLAACFQSHPAQGLDRNREDCYACHSAEYAATVTPVHLESPEFFTTSCDGCHTQTSWKPVAGGLHETFLLASGAHAGSSCRSCHDPSTGAPSEDGANTNCVRCHPNHNRLFYVHNGVRSPTGELYTYQASVRNFCLPCHPAGTALKHPVDLYALRGNHAVPCADCHDRTAGDDAKGANVTCVDSSCHHTLNDTDGSKGHEDAAYRDARGNGTSRNFCHACHS